MNISNFTYDNWRILTIHQRNVVHVNHGLASYFSNNAQPAGYRIINRSGESILRQQIRHVTCTSSPCGQLNIFLITLICCVGNLLPCLTTTRNNYPHLCGTYNKRVFRARKGLRRNNFSIVDESASNNGFQYKIIYDEGTKHGSMQVVSMLHHFSQAKSCLTASLKCFTNIATRARARTRKIVLVYLLLCITHVNQDEIVCHFTTIGHTNFRLDEGIGLIRTHILSRVNALSIYEVQILIEVRSVLNRCFLFPVEEVCYWKYFIE